MHDHVYLPERSRVSGRDQFLIRHFVASLLNACFSNKPPFLMTVVCEKLYQYFSYTFCSLLKCNTRFTIALLSPLSQINRWQSIAAGWRSGFTTQIKTAKTTAHLSDKMRRGLLLCQVVNGADHSVWFQMAIQRRERQREGEREREGILSEGDAETNPTRDEWRRVNHSCHFSISALMPRPVKTQRREENSFPLKKRFLLG